MMSGIDNVTPIPKYLGFEQYRAINNQRINNYIPGEEKADYYKYVATDKNIIKMASDNANIGFKVFNKDFEVIYTTSEKDATSDSKTRPGSKVFHVRSDGSNYLELGQIYYIVPYCTQGYTTSGYYTLNVGEPALVYDFTRNNILADRRATISAKKATTFYFDVKGAPKSAKAYEAVVAIGSSMDKGAHTLTSPNFQMFNSKLMGSGIHNNTVEIPLNYLDFNSYKNAVVNGSWKVSMFSSGSNYTTQPQLTLYYYYEVGTEDIF